MILIIRTSAVDEFTRGRLHYPLSHYLTFSSGERKPAATVNTHPRMLRTSKIKIDQSFVTIGDESSARRVLGGTWLLCANLSFLNLAWAVQVSPMGMSKRQEKEISLQHRNNNRMKYKSR